MNIVNHEKYRKNTQNEQKHKNKLKNRTKMKK